MRLGEEILYSLLEVLEDLQSGAHKLTRSVYEVPENAEWVKKVKESPDMI